MTTTATETKERKTRKKKGDIEVAAPAPEPVLTALQAWQQSIPWDSIDPELNYVAMDASGPVAAFKLRPTPNELDALEIWETEDRFEDLDGLFVSDPDLLIKWRESLTLRPGYVEPETEAAIVVASPAVDRQDLADAAQRLDRTGTVDAHFETIVDTSRPLQLDAPPAEIPAWLPHIPWKSVPEECNHVAWNEDGEANGFDAEPRFNETLGIWMQGEGAVYALGLTAFSLPPSYEMRRAAKLSLCTRPAPEVAAVEAPAEPETAAETAEDVAEQEAEERAFPSTYSDFIEAISEPGFWAGLLSSRDALSPLQRELIGKAVMDYADLLVSNFASFHSDTPDGKNLKISHSVEFDLAESKVYTEIGFTVRKTASRESEVQDPRQGQLFKKDKSAALTPRPMQPEFPAMSATPEPAPVPPPAADISLNPEDESSFEMPGGQGEESTEEQPEATEDTEPEAAPEGADPDSIKNADENGELAEEVHLHNLAASMENPRVASDDDSQAIHF